MAKNEPVVAKAEERVAAVAVVVPLQLPPGAIEQYRVDRWSAAKIAAQHVDDAGQRWIDVRVPIGGRLARRSEVLVAVALVPSGGDGFCVARLELPIAIAGQYAAETTDPERREEAVLIAQKRIAEIAAR